MVPVQRSSILKCDGDHEKCGYMWPWSPVPSYRGLFSVLLTVPGNVRQMVTSVCMFSPSWATLRHGPLKMFCNNGIWGFRHGLTYVIEGISFYNISGQKLDRVTPSPPHCLGLPYLPFLGRMMQIHIQKIKSSTAVWRDNCHAQAFPELFTGTPFLNFSHTFLIL